jgi:hypothetical protein
VWLVAVEKPLTESELAELARLPRKKFDHAGNGYDLWVKWDRFGEIISGGARRDQVQPIWRAYSDIVAGSLD